MNQENALNLVQSQKKFINLIASHYHRVLCLTLLDLCYESCSLCNLRRSRTTRRRTWWTWRLWSYEPLTLWVHLEISHIQRLSVTRQVCKLEDETGRVVCSLTGTRNVLQTRRDSGVDGGCRRVEPGGGESPAAAQSHHQDRQQGTRSPEHRLLHQI